MTTIIVHEVAALTAAAPSMDARTTEEEEVVDTTEIAVTTRVQGETIRIAPIDMMVTDMSQTYL
jgi:hypothetical protein